MRIYNTINDDVLTDVKNVLNNDGLIIIPTDTVYGIACNAFSDKAIKKLFLAKKRSFDKPINVLVDSIDKINLVVDNINTLEEELISKYFPGKLTLIFNKKQGVSNVLTSNQSTIGVRIPDCEIALKILKSYPYPLACSSANISGLDCATELNEFIDAFSSNVDIVIYNGKLGNVASTIVRVEDDNINVLREGDIKF